MNKHQIKYINTAILMDKALIELIDEKDFDCITIKEICDKAGVNRSTFYLHYENIVDLLKETTEYITDNFLSYFSVDKDNLRINFENIDLKDLFFITPEYILPYLTYIKENRKVFRTAIRHLGSMNFDAVYERMFNFIFDPILERFDFPETERKYVIKFYLTGVTAVAMEWLNDDCRDSIETISEIISKCIINKREAP